MSFKILLSPRAKKDLDKLERQVLFRIDKALLILAEGPYLSGAEAVKDKRLAQFRIRIGDYRVLYDVYPKSKVVYILRIGHRKDIYR